MAAGKHSPGCSCCGGGGSCVYTFAPTGLNGLPLPNATITFTPSGGGAAVACATDCSGTCSVVLLAADSYTWAAAHPRFTDAPSGSVATGCPGPNLIAPAFSTLATNFHPTTSCAEPLSATLSINGGSLITWLGSYWGNGSSTNGVIRFDGGPTLFVMVFGTPANQSLTGVSCCAAGASHPRFTYTNEICEVGSC